MATRPRRRRPLDFRFPPPKAKDAAITYQTYSDMNLTTLPQPSVQIGRSAAGASSPAAPIRQTGYWLIAAALALIAAGVAWVAARRRRAAAAHGPRPRDLFHMPEQLDGFAVAALLRRLARSPLVSLPEPQKRELHGDLDRVQKACFGTHLTPLSDEELRGLAEKWLRLAT